MGYIVFCNDEMRDLKIRNKSDFEKKTLKEAYFTIETCFSYCKAEKEGKKGRKIIIMKV